MKKTRLITAAIILALLIGGFWLFRQGAQRRAKEQFAGLETEPVRRGALFSTIEASGIVRANQSALLTWETSGQVDWIAGNPGTAVSEGQTLAQIRENTLPAEIILAQADLVNLQRQLDTLLNSSLAQAEALKAIEQAEQDLEDAHHPEMAQAQALQAVANAKNDLETAQTQLAILTKPTPQSAIEQAYANKLLAKKQLEDLQDEIARTERKSKGPFAPWESAKMYKRILDGLQLQLPQAQLRYEKIYWNRPTRWILPLPGLQCSPPRHNWMMPARNTNASKTGTAKPISPCWKRNSLMPIENMSASRMPRQQTMWPRCKRKSPLPRQLSHKPASAPSLTACSPRFMRNPETR